MLLPILFEFCINKNLYNEKFLRYYNSEYIYNKKKRTKFRKKCILFNMIW